MTKINNGETLRLANLSCFGVALLPARSVKDHLKAGAVARVLPAYATTISDLDSGIYAVYLSRRNLPVKTRLFIDHLAIAFGKQDWA